MLFVAGDIIGVPRSADVEFANPQGASGVVPYAFAFGIAVPIGIIGLVQAGQVPIGIRLFSLPTRD